MTEALLDLDRVDEAQPELDRVGTKLNPAAMSGTWGEYLRIRGRLHAAAGRSTEAYHAFGQSVSVFELLGERHQAGLSYLELGRLAGGAGARSRAQRYLTDAIGLFESLGAAPDLAEAQAALATVPIAATGGYVGVQMDGDDALVRRIVDAAVMPALLAREGATALLEACDAIASVICSAVAVRPASCPEFLRLRGRCGQNTGAGLFAQAEPGGPSRHVGFSRARRRGTAVWRRVVRLVADSRRGATFSNAVRGASSGFRAVFGA